MDEDKRRFSFGVEDLANLAEVTGASFFSGSTHKDRELGEDYGDVLRAGTEGLGSVAASKGVTAIRSARVAAGDGEGGGFCDGRARWAWAMRRHCGALGGRAVWMGTAADLISSLRRADVSNEDLIEEIGLK